MTNDRELALTGATVLVGASLAPHRDCTVLIGGGRVRDVGADVRIPPAVRGLDLTGHTVLPGLIDTHVHLGAPETALRRPAATSAAAGALGAHHLGAVEPGRAADLLAVRGDPLTGLDALREVALALRDGRAVVDRTREKAS